MHPSDGTRRRIVTGMCFTTRHDYGLVEIETDHKSFVITAMGMSAHQREALYRQMDQLYDHHIDPLVGMLTEILGNTDDEKLKLRIQLAIERCSHG